MKVEYEYDKSTSQTKSDVLRKYGERSMEYRQACRNWEVCAEICRQTVRDVAVASHGLDVEQGWWYVKGDVRMRAKPVYKSHASALESANASWVE